MYQLVAGVLDHAPADLTAAEVLVLVAIAENTRALGEVREIGTDALCRRARVDARGLRHVIARLAKHGIKVRVPIGTDRLGKPLYATPGRVPRWCRRFRRRLDAAVRRARPPRRRPRNHPPKADPQVLLPAKPQLRKADTQVPLPDAEVPLIRPMP